MWQWMDEKGEGRGWFSDEDRKNFENHPDLQNGTWREVNEEEQKSFNRWIGRMAYEQA